MDNKKYFWQTLVLALIVTPIIVSITTIPGLMWAPGYVLPPIILFLFWRWRFNAKTPPTRVFDQILPIVIPMILYLGIWVVCNFLGKYDYASGYQDYALLITGLFTLPNFIMLFEGEYALAPYMFMATYGVILLTLAWHNFRRRNWYPQWNRASSVLIAIVIAVNLVPVYQSYQHAKHFVTVNPATKKQAVGDEIKLTDYAPFTNSAKLTKMDATKAMTFSSDYPILDGATAAYPVYASLTQALYQGLTRYTVKNYVQCNQTSDAYKRLIQGKVDMIFVAQPSTAQLAAAKKQGVTLRLTPIAKEAFVFFNNRDNKVADLTTNQVQQIYQKKITNWQVVGGAKQTIIPYQRPADSGSQTIMEKKVMQGKKLTTPLKSEMAEGMGGVISNVAAYQNKKGALGYSFRYYATGMNANPNINLIAIDGVTPTVKNIKNNRYPFTVNLYAVTNDHPTENTQKLLRILQSSWGQDLVQKVGYVPLGK